MRKDFSLTPLQRAQAREAIQLLEGSGLTMPDAARIALVIGKRAHKDATVDQAYDAYIRRCIAKELRGRSVQFYEEGLKDFCNDFQGKNISSITRPALKAYLEALPLASATIQGRWRCIRALFRFAARQDPPWLSEDPTAGLKLDLPAKSHKEIKILTPKEVQAIMKGAGDYRATLALVFFGGVRVEEVRGRGDDKPPLCWGHIDFDAKHIRIPANISKTGKPRIQEGLPDNLWLWLEQLKCGDKKTPICPFQARQAIDAAQRCIKRKWPQNAHRHSCATYHLARHGDPGKTSVHVGHEGIPALLYRSYRGLATKDQAIEYYAISPSVVVSQS